MTTEIADVLYPLEPYVETTPFRLADILRVISTGLEMPVVAILILLILGVAVLIGWLFAELITERRHLKVKLPELLDNMRLGEKSLREVISKSGLLKSQKEALLELTRHPDFNDAMLEALVVRLIEEEQARYDRVLRISETVSRLGPMVGLLGTLIPLGPGILALGQGDTFALSAAMLTAFDTTIAGLTAAALATVVTTVRRTWYRNYMSLLEALAACVLEILKEGCVESEKVTAREV